jgi:hypothetical protein
MNTLKRYWLFAIMGIMAIFLNSCQEDDLNKETKKDDFKFQTITISQVKNHSLKASALFTKTINQTSQINRISTSSQIDSSSVVFLERENGFKSFSYRLKDDLTKSEFNNIVLYEYPDGSTKSFTIKYLLNKSLLDATLENSLKTSIVGYETKVFNTNSITQRGGDYTCVSVGYWTQVDKCGGQLVTPSQNPGCFNSDGTRATKEVFITLQEVCGFQPSGGSGTEGIYVGGTPTNTNQNTGGDMVSIDGIYIPNPYEFGEEDPNNPDFVLSGQVSQFLTTIPSWNSIVYYANTYSGVTFWMQPFFVDYFKNNGGLTTENKNIVKSVVDRFYDISNIQDAYKMYENSIVKNVITYKLFQTFIAYPTVSAEVVQQVYIYRDQNLWSNESVEFTELMLNSSINGFEVDFQKNIIYGITKPCQKDIVKDLISTSSPFINAIKNTFDSSNNINVNFSNGNIPGGNAYTNPFYIGNSQSHTISIRFDDTYLNSATNLSIATTTLHELVHAYLMNLYISGKLVSTNSEYNNLLNAFMAFYEKQVPDTFDTLDNEIHNAMEDFISKMANSLYNYAKLKNIPDSADYCEQLAWGSMYGTNLFQTVLTSQQQIDYGNSAAIEQENFAGAKGSPCN